MVERRPLLPDTFRERAFLGGEAEKIEEVAGSIHRERILSPIDDPDRRKVYGKAIRVVNGLALGADSVGALERTLVDPNKSEEQKRLAGEGLDVLGKSVFAVMRWGGDQRLQDTLGLGSTEKIEEVLPEPFKGLGERVRACIFDENGPVVAELNRLDNVRRACEKLPKDVGGRKLAEGIERTVDELLKMGVDNEHRGEWETAVAYLGVEMERIGVGREEVEKMEAVGDARSDRKSRVIVPPIGREGGMETAAAMAALEALENVEALTGTSAEEVRLWAAKVVDRLMRSPLSFAGRWQYLIDPLEESLIDTFNRLGVTRIAEINEGLDCLRSVLELRACEKAVFSADGTIGGFISYIPPEPVIEEYKMSKIATLKDDSVVGWVRETVLADVKRDDGAGGGDIVKWWNKKGLDEWLDGDRGEYDEQKPWESGLRERFRQSAQYAEINGKYKGALDDDRNLNAVLRLGLSYWTFNDYPKVAVWVGGKKISEERANDVAISQGQLLPVVRERFGWVNTMASEARQVNRWRERGKVYSLSSQIGQTTGIDHPIASMREPMGILIAKNAWNKEVIDVASEALRFLFVRLWKWDKENDRPASTQVEPCLMGYKQLKRWDEMWGCLFGKSSQASEFDDFKEFEGGLYLIQNLLVSSRNVRPEDVGDIGGVVAGKLVLAKTWALMLERKPGSEIGNLIAGMAIDRVSIPAEMDQAMKALSGSVGSDFGALKESVAALGFNYNGVEEIKQAMSMLITECNAPELAESSLKFKRWALGLKAIFDVSMGQVGGGKRR